MMSRLTDKLTGLKNKITSYEQKYQRDVGSVLLLAVSKGRSTEEIIAAYDAGQRHFGENYVQEALPKQIECPRDIVWHYIGKIQSNKTAKIAAHFDWAHGVENEKTAQRLNDQRPASLSKLNICLSVNIDSSSTKSGVSSAKIHDLALYCSKLPNLHLRGLMVFPDLRGTLIAQREIFHKAWVLFSTLRQQGIEMDTLSMGTSLDFEAAIAEGATIVRIGKALFR